MREAVFRDLRDLADWFATRSLRASPQIAQLVERLGATAVPLLGRELTRPDPGRRDAARTALATIAAHGAAARARVLAELHTIAGGEVACEARAAARDLLSELAAPGRDSPDPGDLGGPGDLGDARHRVRGHTDPSATALARAIELVAAGDHPRALIVLEACDPAGAEAAATLAAILLAQGKPGPALAALERALAAEPDWPLHHWNVAAALHQLGDPRGCYHALRRFVATSAIPSGLYADPDQPARVGRAERLIAELERTARLTGTSLRRRPRAKKARGSIRS